MNQPKSDSYFRVQVRGLRRDREDLFTELCFTHGAQGMAEDLQFVQPEIIYDPTVVTTDRFDLNVYFQEPPGEEFFDAVKTRFSGVVVELHREESQDWLQNWKKHFAPFLFADPFWIVPSWCEPPAEAKEFLWIDPGMAFGTGTHETTRLAARQLIDALGKIPQTDRSKLEVLDVGTGTGVLALIAERMGVGRTVGIDIDPEARRVARENLQLNQSSLVEILDSDLSELKESFDVIIANIIDGVLLQLKPDLLRLLKPNGRLVLSGILTERESEFLDGFLEQTERRNRRRLTKGEWSSFLVQ